METLAGIFTLVFGVALIVLMADGRLYRRFVEPSVRNQVDFYERTPFFRSIRNPVRYARALRVLFLVAGVFIAAIGMIGLATN